MKIRIAMLFVVASLFASTVAAHAATTPVDPDKAPIASVDRFSDKAAHLQLRTPGEPSARPQPAGRFR